MALQSELKACPFCGAMAEINKSKHTETYCVECTECDANVGRDFDGQVMYDHHRFDSETAAISAWNRRV